MFWLTFGNAPRLVLSIPNILLLSLMKTEMNKVGNVPRTNHLKESGSSTTTSQIDEAGRANWGSGWPMV